MRKSTVISSIVARVTTVLNRRSIKTNLRNERFSAKELRLNRVNNLRDSFCLSLETLLDVRYETLLLPIRKVRTTLQVTIDYMGL